MLTGFDFVSAVRALAPGADLIDVESRVDQLMARWSEPHRKYHTTVHLAEVLAAGEQLRHAGELTRHDLPLFHLAAWFHDAVYDVHSPGNEAGSASLAHRWLTDLGVPPRDVAEVETLITLTTMHHVEDLTSLRAAFHDADLWILSAPTPRYAAYRLQVREEFAHVPDSHFAMGRAAVIRPFAERANIYLTRLGREAWEPRARVNLEAELAEHTASPGFF